MTDYFLLFPYSRMEEVKHFKFDLNVQLFSAVDPDPVGSVSFGWIRIRIVKWENGSETDLGSEKNYQNIIILYYF